jgi:hypothetical protein
MRSALPLGEDSEENSFGKLDAAEWVAAKG